MPIASPSRPAASAGRGFAESVRSTLSDTALFVREWLQAPSVTASVTPSSRVLAGAMARYANPEGGRLVLELGAGTGAVTQAILNRGVPQDRIVCVENSRSMASVLRRRFRQAHVLCGDAREFDTLMLDRLGDVGSVDVVISSLPLKNFPAHESERLAEKIRLILGPRGTWVQFSYNLRRIHPPGSERFDLVSSDVVWRNIPPARLSVYRKNGRG